jgi:hypothetical protein
MKKIFLVLLIVFALFAAQPVLAHDAAGHPLSSQTTEKKQESKNKKDKSSKECLGKGKKCCTNTCTKAGKENCTKGCAAMCSQQKCGKTKCAAYTAKAKKPAETK